MKKKGRNIEELNKKWWITYLAFLLDVNVLSVIWTKSEKVKISSLLRCRTIGSPMKSSLDRITLFTFHTWQLLRLFILSVFMNIPSPLFCFVKRWANESRTSKLWNKKYYCLLCLWMQILRRIQKVCKSNSLICSVLVFLPETVWRKLARIWSLATKRKDFYAQIDSRMIVMFFSYYMWEQFFYEQ